LARSNTKEKPGIFRNAGLLRQDFPHEQHSKENPLFQPVVRFDFPKVFNCVLSNALNFLR
jgi:hypothetical protein